ncbi:MAG: T9SS type A sorting domain-containing protein [Aquaticitalea sp.]
MKHTLLFIIFICLPLAVCGQTIAYPSVNTSKVFGASCADLHFTNAIVIGHQLDVSVAYYETLTDAQSEVNPLDRFYEPLSDPQTIYARVDSLLDDSFDIAESVVDTAPIPSGPPPGISSYYYDVCDFDTDGIAMVFLNNLQPLYEGYAFPTSSFCASADEDVVTTYYLTESDAMNETNPVNAIYSLTGTQNFYRKIKNTTTDEFLIDDMINVTVVTCSTDTDMDGIADLVEDVNKNLQFTDDDTDQDGLKNYEDDDDDGDGILTIDEDYNGNGDPTDDDTNGNGIADYLEASVTLAVSELNVLEVSVFPNPVTDMLNLKSVQTMTSVKVYNLLGQVVMSSSPNALETSVNLSSFRSGVYVLKVAIGNRAETFKVVKE